jgi:hypothetical protein
MEVEYFPKDHCLNKISPSRPEVMDMGNITEASALLCVTQPKYWALISQVDSCYRSAVYTN